MNKLMIIAAALCAAILTGCSVFDAEFGGEEVVTDKNGQPYVVNGVVQKRRMPNKIHSNRHWMDSEIESAGMKAKENGEYEWNLNGYSGKISPEYAKVIDTTMQGAALVTREAIATAMTSGISYISRDAFGTIERMSKNYIDAGGTLIPNIKVTRNADGKIADIQISDGRVTETCKIQCDSCGEDPNACKDCTVPASAPAAN